MRALRKILLITVTLLVLVAVAWTAITLNFVYSTGERTGYVQKISRKGWICKTWEGELAMANLPGTMPRIFEFTVPDDAVAQQVERHGGQRVTVQYEEHPGIPTSCFGDTGHFVVGVRPVAEAAPGP